MKLKSYNLEELVLGREYSTHANIAKINAFKTMQKEGMAIVTPRMKFKYDSPLQGTILSRVREYGKRTSASGNTLFGKLSISEIKQYAPELFNDKSFVSNFTAVKTTVGFAELEKTMNISRAELIKKLKTDWYNYKIKLLLITKNGNSLQNKKQSFRRKTEVGYL